MDDITPDTPARDDRLCDHGFPRQPADGDRVLIARAPAEAAINVDIDLEDLRIAMLTSAPVLIVGDDEAWRYVVARQIHDGSSRSGQTWRSCDADLLTPASLREAYEDTAGGTLFINAIDRLTDSCQEALSHLLADPGRLLDAGAASMRHPRVLSGVCSPIRTDLANAAFSGTLLYRLNVIRIELPVVRRW